MPREGVCLEGCLPRWCLTDTPLRTESQTDVKTLPSHNNVADGNNNLSFLSVLFTTSQCHWLSCDKELCGVRLAQQGYSDRHRVRSTVWFWLQLFALIVQDYLRV